MAVLLAPGLAVAQETEGSASASGGVELSTEGDVETESSDAPGPLVLGAEIGAIFPQPFTELGTHVDFGIEVGYLLPYLHRQLEVFFAAGFAPPGVSFEVDKVEGGDSRTYEGEVRQQELFFSLGPRYRFMKPENEWNVGLAAGFRLFLLRSFSNGSSEGEKFAEFREQSTQPGFFAALGGEYRLGPGSLLLDIDFGYSALPHKITGHVSTGNIAATLGYRFFLL